LHGEASRFSGPCIPTRNDSSSDFPRKLDETITVMGQLDSVAGGEMLHVGEPNPGVCLTIVHVLPCEPAFASIVVRRQYGIASVRKRLDLEEGPSNSAVLDDDARTITTIVAHDH
jgi:hypothetical protein